jgi:UDPglucose 6-dehydrogenase
MNITIIGTGFVGVVSAAVFASFGNKVTGLDIDQNKVASLTSGKVPFFEPGLEELLGQQLQSGNLRFTTSYEEAIPNSEVIIIAVGTPSAANGQADLTYVLAAAESSAPYLTPDSIVAVKSTVPPGTLDKVTNIIKRKTDVPFHIASLPEFLREGSAVKDTLHPDRVVLGAANEFTYQKLTELHAPFNAPLVKVSPESAQMGKYTANAFLATRITFINEIANLCQKNGASITEVIEVIGKDKRIGDHYWYPGFGYGGSCFPKDVNELAAYSRSVGEEDNLLNKISAINTERIPRLLTEYEKQIGSWQGQRVAVLGLSFKPHTNDMREAPSVKVIPHLLSQGAHVVGYDPKALEVADHFITPHPHLEYVDSVAKAVQGAEVIIALIEWPEIVTFDFAQALGTTQPNKLTHKPIFIDARNQFSKKDLLAAGYTYLGVGV